MILRRVARPLLASIFIYGGINVLRYPEGHAKAAEPVLDKLLSDERKEKLPDSVPTDPQTLVKIHGAVKIAAGTALAFGWFPRVAALALAGTIVPTTAAAHRFWEESEPEQRQQQLVHFLKNCGLAGGLLLAVADTHGKPSAAWWARHGAHMAGRRLEGTGRSAKRHTRRHTRHGGQHAQHSMRHAQHGIEALQEGVRTARKASEKRAHKLQKASEKRLNEARKVSEQRLREARKAGGKHLGEARKVSEKRLGEARKMSEQRARKVRKASEQRLHKARKARTSKRRGAMSR